MPSEMDRDTFIWTGHRMPGNLDRSKEVPYIRNERRVQKQANTFRLKFKLERYVEATSCSLVYLSKTSELFSEILLIEFKKRITRLDLHSPWPPGTLPGRNKHKTAF